MGRQEKQLDPQTGPLAQLACDLRELRRVAGSPTYRAMSSVAKYSPSALSAAAGGAALPSEGVLAAYVAACGGDVADYLRRRARIVAGAAGSGPASASIGSVPASAPASASASIGSIPTSPSPSASMRSVPASPSSAACTHDGLGSVAAICRPTRTRPASERPHPRRLLRHRAAGVVAAMLLGSIATVVPMAIWGAPSCLSPGNGQPVPATSCHAAGTR